MNPQPPEGPHLTVNQICHERYTVFVEATNKLARGSGFCLRRSPFRTEAYVRGLVFGWLHDLQASVSALARAFAASGVAVSPQAVQQQFSEAVTRSFGGDEFALNCGG